MFDLTIAPIVVAITWLMKYFLWWFILFRCVQAWASDQNEDFKKWAWVLKLLATIVGAAILALIASNKNADADNREWFTDNGYSDKSQATAYLLSYFWFFFGTLGIAVTNPKKLD